MEKTGIIYMATNKISGKSYIGQTIRALKKRIREHFYDSNIIKKDGSFKHTFKFANALRKYQEGDWKWKILLDDIPQKYLATKEEWSVAKHDTFHNGYNSTKGGEDCPMRYEESRRKLSESKMGTKRPDLSERNKRVKYFGEKNPKSKLNWEKVKEIRDKYLSGKFTSVKLGKEYGVAPNTILGIIENKSWKNDDYNVDFDKIREIKRRNLSGKGGNNYGARLSWDRVEKIRSKYLSGNFSLSKLATKYEVSKDVISRIVNNKFWIDPLYKADSNVIKEIGKKNRKKEMSGENSPLAKLTWGQTREIREKYLSGGLTSAKLANQYNVSPSTVLRVINNKAWEDPLCSINGDVAKKIGKENEKMKKISGEDNPHAKLTWDIVREIRSKYSFGKFSYDDLSKEYHVSKPHIGRIINNENWKIPPKK